MVKTSDRHSVELIKNRLFQGGRLLAVWQVFRAGQLTGAFVFKGQQWSTCIDLKNGKVQRLVFQEQGRKISGMDGFAALKHKITSDGATRFTVLVPE